MRKIRIAVAMSGGVDSSVTAALLTQQGHEVVGITMCFNLPEKKGEGRPACCSMQGINDARRVCDTLGIRHYVLNFDREMERTVIADFVAEYSKGRTPNPCVRCNDSIKFQALLSRVLRLGFGKLATGHYARVLRRGGRYYLAKAKDLAKDQSYFLYRLTQERLARIVFPLGELTKAEVREIARRNCLPVAEKRESQEICFIAGDYRSFLETRGLGRAGPGEIVDRNGRVLGVHKGVAYYTVGQRSGLGIPQGYPVYVQQVDAAANRIVVGNRGDLEKREFSVSDLVFPTGRPRKRTFMCRIRHLSKEAPVRVTLGKDSLVARFDEPQFAITPGQSAVFYEGEKVRCGGIIEEVKG